MKNITDKKHDLQSTASLSRNLALLHLTHGFPWNAVLMKCVDENVHILSKFQRN